MTKKLVYDVPSWHDTLYHSIKDTVGNLTKTIEIAKGNYKEYDTFTGEIFSRMYSNNRVSRMEDVPYWNGWAEKAHSIIDEIPEAEILWNQVAYDQVLSAYATATIADAVYSKLPCQCETQTEELERLYELLEVSEDNEQVQNDIEEAKAKLPDIDQERSETIRSALRKAIDQTSKDIEEISVAAKTCGINTSSLNKDNNRQFMDLLKVFKSDKNLRKIIEMAGRFVSLYTSMKKKTTRYARTEASGLTIGNNIQRALVSEMLPEDLFAYKFATSSILEHEIKGIETKAKGPIVLCIDMSGSMHGAPENIAKAIALALYSIMKKEKRELQACLFNNKVMAELRQDNIIDFLCCNALGGTDLAEALKWADGRLEDADIIVITDGGIDDVSAYKHLEVISILISGSDQDAKHLKPISSSIIRTSNLTPESVFKVIL